MHGGFHLLDGSIPSPTAVKARMTRLVDGIVKGTRLEWIRQCVLALWLAFGCCSEGLAQSELYTIELPAMSVAAALNELAAQTGIQVLFPFDLVRGRQANALAGTYTLQQALTILLRGTGLSGGLSKKGVLTISRERSDASSNQGETSMTPQDPGREPNRRDTRKTFVSSLVAFIVSGGTALNAGAQSTAGESVAPDRLTMLEEVTVTGSRMQKQISDVTTSVSIVTEEQLAEQFSISNDVLDALNSTVPGLNVSQGFGRIGCNMNVRGRTANFQINGIPVNQDLRESNCNAMYQISPFALERIEVIRGASALYGAGAPGGTINLITRRARSSELETDGIVRMSANPKGVSDTQSYEVYAGAGQRFEEWDYYVGLGYQDMGAARTPRDGLVPLEEFTSWSFNGALGRDIGETGQLRITGTFYREERGKQYSVDGTQTRGSFGTVIPIDDHPYKDQNYDQLLTFMASYEQEEVLGHTLAVSAYLQSQKYLQRANEYSVTWGGNFFSASNTENERLGFRSTLARDFKIGNNSLELEYGVDYVSNMFYRPFVDPANGGAIVGWVSPEITFDTASGFFQSDYVVGRLRVSGGLRYERYEGEVGDRGYNPTLPNSSTPGKTDSSDLWLGNIGAVFDITDALQIYGGFSQGAELSQLARAVRGVSDPRIVSPEPAESHQYEIGVRGLAGSVEYSAAAFYSESDRGSLLQVDARCAGQQSCPLIPLRTPQRFHGVEGTLDWKATERLTTGAIFTLQKGEIYDIAQGRYLDYSAQHVSPLRLTGYLELSPTEKARVRLQGTYYGASDYYSAGEAALGLYNTDSLFLMDLSSSYGVGPGEFTMSISNLLDKEYVNIANQAAFQFFYYMEEGRRVSLGYRVRF
jgi:iron complex outermembrane receptor protein